MKYIGVCKGRVVTPVRVVGKLTMPSSRKPPRARANKVKAPLEPQAKPRPKAATSLRELSKLRTRQALIDAALACFAEHGLDAPSLDAICERAGCTRGAFYVHFPDRDALIVAAMAQRRNAVVSAFLSASPGTIPTLKVLDLFAAAVDSGAFPAPGAVRTQDLLAACRRSSAIKNAQLTLMAELGQRLTANISVDQAQGRLRSDVAAGDLSTLVLVLEAGVELLLDLGYELELRSTVGALRKLIVADGSPSR